jgi:PD-(D/E)XK nuclease superfamily
MPISRVTRAIAAMSRVETREKLLTNYCATFGLLRALFLPVTESAITGRVVDAAYRIHSTLGPGLLETVYQAAMIFELGKCGLQVVS